MNIETQAAGRYAERLCTMHLRGILGALPFFESKPEGEDPSEKIRGLHRALMGEHGCAVIHPDKPHGLGCIEVNLELPSVCASLVVLVHEDTQGELYRELAKLIKEGSQ